VVRRRGENISSYEVERVINDHPKVQESAVVGVPSELTEEEVLAVIVVKENETLEPEDLLQYCQRHLPSFSLPAYIRMVKEFPRTPSQRIEKYKLREEGVTEDTWIREAARKRASLNNIL
jgi:crotonobetaine/carnitine-CoA ligase